MRSHFPSCIATCRYWVMLPHTEWGDNNNNNPYRLQVLHSAHFTGLEMCRITADNHFHLSSDIDEYGILSSVSCLVLAVWCFIMYFFPIHMKLPQIYAAAAADLMLRIPQLLLFSGWNIIVFCGDGNLASAKTHTHGSTRLFDSNSTYEKCFHWASLSTLCVTFFVTLQLLSICRISNCRKWCSSLTTTYNKNVTDSTPLSLSSIFRSKNRLSGRRSAARLLSSFITWRVRMNTENG